ncbi:MAG: lysophospholipid acyltransferase family protein [Candidatus Omnitrophica bacterium]|nr:lysophospholipid acyltransferase family protein [Candidatus Omnitrophota bacterium]
MGTESSKKFKRAMARWAYRFFSQVFRVLPYGAIRAMTKGLLAIGYFILRRMRKIAMESLTIALGREKSPAELEKICKDCFYNAGQGAIELVAFSTRPGLIVEKFRFEGDSRRHLDAALNEGKGVLAISAHFGDFPLMLLYLSQIGYPTSAIIRPSRDEVIEQDFQAARTRLGLKTIYSYPRETCVRQSLKSLRGKELLIVLLDQNTGSKSGVFVDFFGQKAGTATGPIIFAMRTGSPILPIFTVRDGEDSHKIIIEPHFYLEPKATDEETIQYNVQKITNIIERYIRAYPKEWGWMHRRWKSKQQTIDNRPETKDQIL